MNDRPNIVMIITDQQRFDTIGALGHDFANTPTLDRMVQEGVAFDQAYITAPACAPSRASLFTGLYPHTNGVMSNDQMWTHSWVEDLNASGYRCVNVGKMHTYPYEQPVGFHERHVVENKDRATPRLPFFLDNWDKALWTHGLEKPTRATLCDRDDYRESLGAFVWELPPALHADNFVGDLACEWLRRYPLERGPFFLEVGFPGPHPPYDPTPEAIENQPCVRMPLPIRDQRDIDSLPEPLKAVRDYHLANDHDAIVHLEHSTDEQAQRQRDFYMANVTMIDHQVGQLIATLEEQGVLDNTVIIFTSDHGDILQEHGLSQKWNMYDPVVRVPCIIWAPGLQLAQGVVHDKLVSLLDIAATVLELAKVEVPAWFEAESLVPALYDSNNWHGREAVFAEHGRDRHMPATDLMTMIRSGEYKLVCFAGTDEGQLFNLPDDPNEIHNLWDDPEHGDIKSQLLRKISDWRASSDVRTSGWKAQYR